MKIAIIGNRGSTGVRYQRILNEMGGHTIIGYDLQEAASGLPLPKADRYIIATPTALHYAYWNFLWQETKPENILCEKPISMDTTEIINMYIKTPEMRMVDNWRRVFPDRILTIGQHKVTYDFFKTGPHGMDWDCLQLRLLAAESPEALTIGVDSKTLKAKIDGEPVTLEMIEKSYRRMIKSWLGPNSLWTVADVKEAHLELTD